MCEDYPCCGHDLNECGWWDEDPLTAEEQEAADRAYYLQQEQEAYAEFLDAPNCFDWGSLGGAPPDNEMVTIYVTH